MILFFSGTGNTRLVATRLGALLGEKVLEMDVRAAAEQSFTLAPGERMVWCFPIYSWGVPPVVVKVIERTEIEGAVEAEHIMVCTCGDDCGNADRQWRRLLRGRGWKGSEAYSVQMPNTYVLMKGFDTDSPEVVAAKLSAAPSATAAIADAIKEGRPGNYVRGRWAWLKSMVIYPWFCRFAMSPEPFHTNGVCTACGRCSRICPTGNITPDGEGLPCWGDDCALCLRCYHSCPRRAIRYGRATDVKGVYMAPLKFENQS